MIKHNACVFTDNFCAYADREHPGDWVVEQHTDRAHRHGRVEGGAYHILCRGNKHIPLTLVNDNYFFPSTTITLTHG